jgi:hypothetical protein
LGTLTKQYKFRIFAGEMSMVDKSMVDSQEEKAKTSSESGLNPFNPKNPGLF